jgi:hypothetical protein
MLQPMQLVDERVTRYATVTDFFATFDEKMHSLYLLAFLLTADHDKAEQCLVCAMGECVDWIGVFTDWAHSWSRRAVLKRAIQMIMPVPEHADKTSTITLKTRQHRARTTIPLPQCFYWILSSASSSSCRHWKGSPTLNVRFF